jgi:hypothetical protein
MKKLLPILAAAAAALPLSAAPAERLSPEAKIEKALKGRVAGEPVDCINIRDVRSSQIVNDTAILYDTGNVIYVNRPAGSESLDQWDVLVTKLHNSRLCSRDVVELYDPSARMQSGFVFLGEFVPYRKAAAAK